jgi:NDP-sugar pyrophosphorylase family protein
MLSQAVILAGGKGTRLLPLTQNIPKPLVDVGGKPFLHWQMRYLKAQGVREVLLLVSHLAPVVQDYFSRHPFPGLQVDFCVEKVPLGTGGALLHARSKLAPFFWLLNGDSFLYIDLPAMAEAFRQNQWSACLATVPRARVPVAGNVRLDGSSVLEYKRDAGFEFVDAGVYAIDRSIVVQNGPPSSCDLGELWPPLIGRRKLGAFMVNERFFDIGTAERLKTFADHLGDYF